MRFVARSCFLGYCSLLFVITISLALVLFVTSCTGRSPVQDRWGRQFLSHEHGFSFSYPDDWVMVKETSRNGIVTLRLEKQGDGAVKLVVTILPVVLNRDELILEVQKMLKSSLYRIQSVYKEEEKEISGRRLIFIDAVAGENETVLTRTAAFSNGSSSYFFNVLCREEAFTQGTADLEKILASVEVK